MKKIKKFYEFLESNDTLHIFDFDDTLVNSPSFEELAIEYLSEDVTINDLIDLSLSKIKKDKSYLKWENGRIYIDDPTYDLQEVQDFWVRKGRRLYMLPPNMFCKTDLSLPDSLKQLSDLYKSVEEKCIVTARVESMRDKVTSTLNSFGLKLPKYGLHMIPDGRKNAGTWKGEKIVEIINETGFKKAIFYDDNPKFISKATKVVREKLPLLEFKTIRVK